ncbi:MAG: hypothetical protein WDM94_01715 [Bauldia sp.]
MPIGHHLQEIEDDAAREGVSVFKTQMEIVVLSLLDEDRAIALGQIEEARTASLDHAAAFASPALSVAEGAKAERIARAMLTDTFGRIRTVIETPDDDSAVH